MKNKNQPKTIFIQDCGIYSNEIIVAVDCEKKDIVGWIKKHKIKKEAKEWIEKDKAIDEAFGLMNKNNATVAFNEGRFLILLRKLEDCWGYWETLLHETNHITFVIAKDKLFQEEMENQAYLQEYLFRSIRRKLMGLDKK